MATDKESLTVVTPHDLDELARLLEAATPGPWQVHREDVPYTTPVGGDCIERTIHTAYDHPQLGGPAPVVTQSFGLIARPVVSVSDADARLIAAAVNALPALIASARERYGRMCVNCGRTVPVSHPRHEPLPECVGPEGMAACTFDLTLDEAWQHWRQEAHTERLRAEQAEAALLATARRERRMREALVAARAHVALDDAMHDYNPFHEEGEGLDEHDPDACAACMRDAALIAIDAALAEEGQDG
jgi:hypothetical protein